MVVNKELVAAGEAPGLSREQIELIKRTVAVGCTDDELALFLHTCSRYRLDPLVGQVHAIRRRRWDAETRAYVWSMTIQIGIDGYRAMAERTGQYCPGKAPRFEVVELGAKKDLACTVSVMKRVPGESATSYRWVEIEAVAWFSEYVQTDKEGKPNSIWQRRPKGQLEKCAESLALRKAFPTEFGNLRTDEEMAHVPADDAQPGHSPTLTHSPADASSHKMQAEVEQRASLPPPPNDPEPRRQPRRTPTRTKYQPTSAENKRVAVLIADANANGPTSRSRLMTSAELSAVVSELAEARDSADYDRILTAAEATVEGRRELNDKVPEPSRLDKASADYVPKEDEDELPF